MIVTIRVSRDYIRVIVYSYYTTITGWGVLVMYRLYRDDIWLWGSLGFRA